MIHYLLLCHKNFNQVQLLIDKLKTKNSKIYIHVDWKVRNFPKFKNATLIKNRVKTNWWWFSQIKTEVNWVKEIYPNMKEWDHLVIISWQCRPIKKMDYIENYINKLWNKSCLNYEIATKEIIMRVDRYYFNDLDLHMPHLDKLLYYIFVVKLWHNLYWMKVPIINIILSSIVNKIFKRRKELLSKYKLYKWDNWIIISYKHIKWSIEFLNSKKWKEFYNLFKYSSCADELFFQTLLKNSSFKNEIRNEKMWYTKRPKNSSSPYIITQDFYDELKKSDKMFARKFDINVDWKIVEKLAY